jgi:hypothetical protein
MDRRKHSRSSSSRELKQRRDKKISKKTMIIIIIKLKEKCKLMHWGNLNSQLLHHRPCQQIKFFLGFSDITYSCKSMSTYSQYFTAVLKVKLAQKLSMKHAYILRFFLSRRRFIVLSGNVALWGGHVTATVRVRVRVTNFSIFSSILFIYFCFFS